MSNESEKPTVWMESQELDEWHLGFAKLSEVSKINEEKAMAGVCSVTIQCTAEICRRLDTLIDLVARATESKP